MNFIKRYFLKRKINKDVDFILRQGVKKAKEKGIELILGNEETLTFDNPQESMKIPYHSSKK